jgi:hypothetical protein
MFHYHSRWMPYISPPKEQWIFGILISWVFHEFKMDIKNQGLFSS